MSQQLVKAKLFSLDQADYDIEFMFNPTQLDFTRGIKLNQPQGARSSQGRAKVSFAAPDPCVLTLSKVMFDTYEQGTDVLKTYINQLTKAVQFLDGATGGTGGVGGRTSSSSSGGNQSNSNKRPPIYLFIWGAQDYLRCFVESFKYQITMFLPDGTPVRATANLTLKEVDAATAVPNPRTPTEVDRFGDSRGARMKR